MTENPDTVEQDQAGLIPGTMVDHFKVLRQLGCGGMGTVYLCRDTVLGRKIALKVIRPDVLGSHEARKRFLLEAQLTARLSHPHIVTLFGVGEHEGTPWVALEYLDGVTLKQRLEQEPPAFRESLRISLAIAEALEAAHERNVLHRDLKPNNVLLARDGRPRVLDFGLAKLVSSHDDEDRDVTATGKAPEGLEEQELDETRETNVHGTPRYMAPEQWLGDSGTPATDMWAFGLVLHELFLGKHPFAKKAVRTICLAVTRARPVPDVLERAEGLPLDLAELIDQCLRKAPEDRPTAEEAVKQLTRLLAGDPEETAITRTPFRGLLPFAERHAQQFFGRQAEIDVYCERLRHEPMIPVVGASGAGKSSFVQAGVIPRLREQGSWLVIRIRPGSRPFETLAVRLLQDEALSGSSIPTAQLESFPPEPLQIRDRERRLAAELEAHPARLSLHLENLAEKHLARVLLFVDQLEELYTLCPEGEDATRGRFMEALCAASDNPAGPTRVSVTVRDDFLSRLAEGTGAVRAFDRVMVLRAPNADALQRILEKSLRAVAYRFDDPALPKEMVQAVAGESAALPLLQFAGQRLWERRDRKNKVLTRDAYEAMGGVEGALAHHLDNVLAGLSSEQEHIARELFLRLITPQSTRRVLPRSKLVAGLGEDAELVLERLTRERAIVARRGREDTELELVHESLIRTWDRLVRWLEGSREERLFLAEVGQAAALWQQRNEPREEVWRGSALTEALLKAKRVHKLPDTVRRFLDAGVRRDARLAARRKALWASGIILSLLAAFAAVSVSVVVTRQREQAEDQRAEALREGARAAFARGEMMEARAKLRASLETRDSYFARALWWRLHRLPLLWTQRLGALIYDVAFSPDGKTIAATCHNGSVYLFDTRTRAVRVLRGHTDQVTSIAYAPNGKLLATGSWGGTIRLWNLEDGSARELQADTGVWSVVFSPDGKTLASSGGKKGDVLLWDIATGNLERLRGHNSEVYGVVFSHDGLRLATASRDKTIRLWDVLARRQEAVLEGHRAVVWKIGFSPDDDLLASASADNDIILWDIESRSAKASLHGHRDEVRGLAFSPDGKVLASSSNDRTIRLWDIATGRQRAQLDQHQDDVRNVAFSPDGRLLASASYDKTVRVWKVEAAPSDLSGGHEAVTWIVGFSPDGKRVASGSRDKTIRLWDTKTGDQVAVFHGHDANVCGLGFSPDGRTLVSSSYDQTVRLWDAATGQQKAVLRGHEGGVMGVAFDPSGERVVSGSRDKTLRVWSVHDGTTLGVLRGHESAVWTVAFGPKGERIASGGQDNTVRIWDAQSGKQLLMLEGHDEPVMGVSFTPDGEGLASGGTDKTVRLWDLETGEGRIVGRHEGRVYGLDIHPGGGIIGAPSSEGIAKLWTIETGKSRTLRGHRSEVDALRFSRDGKLAATSRRRLDRTIVGGPTRLDLFGEHPCCGRAPSCRPTSARIRLDGGTVNGAKLEWRRAVEQEARFACESEDGRRLCLVRHDDVLQIWDVTADRRIAQNQLAGVEQVVATDHGCAALANPPKGEAGIVLLDAKGHATTLSAREPTALSWSAARLLVASEGKVLVYDDTGKQVASHAADVGITAIRELTEWIAVGFKDGNIELLPVRSNQVSPGFSFEDVPSSPVVSLRTGPQGTVIAGYANGLLGLWSLKNGKQLDRARLHGAISHLLFQDDKLYAASELGQHRVLDLGVFQQDYCELLRHVWQEVPVVWEGGLPVPREPPNQHRCQYASDR